MPDLKEKRVELILQQLEELPTLPAVAVRVMEVTGRDDSETTEVVKLIESDPSLTARILQLVHRADVGIAGQITSVERAVVLLGFEAVRSAVLAVSVFETFRSAEPRVAAPAVATATAGATGVARAGTGAAAGAGVPFDRIEFWKHCVAVACAAEMLADLVRALDGGRRGGDGDINPSEAFVCGLLHDLGKIALAALLPKSFGRVIEAAEMLRGNIADVERTVIGLDHMVVGKRLAERGQLPPAARDCIWLPGQTPAALPAGVASPRMVNLITLADLIVREQHLGYSGNHTFPI